LGTIGTAKSASLLQAALQGRSGDKQAIIDGLLACAESLLHRDKQSDALAIYKSLSGEGQDRLVRLAATRGALACAAKRA
jgi:hypothetical protein